MVRVAGVAMLLFAGYGLVSRQMYGPNGDSNQMMKIMGILAAGAATVYSPEIRAKLGTLQLPQTPVVPPVPHAPEIPDMPSMPSDVPKLNLAAQTQRVLWETQVLCELANGCAHDQTALDYIMGLQNHLFNKRFKGDDQNGNANPNPDVPLPTGPGTPRRH